jgi:hypothetical protein
LVNRLEQIDHRLAAADVGPVRDGIPAGGLDCLYGLVGPGSAARIVDDHLCAVIGEPDRNFPAHTAPSAGHEGNSSRKWLFGH